VELAAVVMRRQLDGGNHMDEARGGDLRLGHAANRIVIRQCDHVQSAGASSSYDGGGRRLPSDAVL
jgi:hypothetical protein